MKTVGGASALFLLLTATALHAQERRDPVAEAARAMTAAAAGPVSLTRSPLTGLATHVAGPSGAGIPVTDRAISPAERALAFLDVHGRAFGIERRSQVRVTRVAEADETGMDHVRLQQLIGGVPVAGGELIVHLKGGRVISSSAKTLPDPGAFDVQPRVEATAALEAARDLLAKRRGRSDAVLSEPRLEILNRGLLEGRRQPTRLAWFVDATGPGLRQFIWVDARRGGVLLDFSQLPTALNRAVYSANDSYVLPGSLRRSEGQPATGDPDVDLAYDYTEHTYNYYWSQHGRDSFDDAGTSIVSSVHYCPEGGPCPVDNAFWFPTYNQLVIGEDQGDDDTVAHEYTHGVIQYTADLYFYMQSGALNESYADIFGETVDLTNEVGNDTPAVRWVLFEDSTGGLRNMMNPTIYGDPGRMSDAARFKCYTDRSLDYGGVHSNSGVPNHAYALMVDGGTYNGHAITGIGLTKAGKIQYRALSHYLGTASDFLDNYNALKQSCVDLMGTAGITAADCAQVTKALDAVEMASPWPCAAAQPLARTCPALQVPTDLFFDDLENTTSGRWVTQTLFGSNQWTGCGGVPDIYCSGFTTSGVAAFLGYLDTTGDAAVAMSSSVTVPPGARMRFEQAYGFENNGSTHYDGGVIEYSVTGGASWSDAGPLIYGGAAYGGVISAVDTNPLAGRPAFVSESFGYTSTQIDLTSLAGQSVRFRFRMGTDSTVTDEGWWIDDVRMYQCTVPADRIFADDFE